MNTELKMLGTGPAWGRQALGRVSLMTFLAAATALLTVAVARATAEMTPPPATRVLDQVHDLEGPVSVPVAFIPNRGQWPPEVSYGAIAGGGALFVTHDGLTIVEPASGSGSTSPSFRRIPFDAAPGALRIVPGPPLPGIANFLRGNDPRRWLTHIPTYANLTVRGLRSGADLHVDGHGVWESITPTSPLPALLPLPQPFLGEGAGGWGPASGSPQNVAATTPTLIYSTFLGGRFNEMIRGLAVDAEGFAYVAGTTTSLDYPTQTAIQPAIGNSGSLQDAFVAKLDPTGTQLVYSTFIGGNRQDEAFGLAIDRIGRVHLTGYTQSPDFPTVGAIQPQIHLADGIFSGDTFITKLKPDGSGIEFSTFFGGTARDVGKDIAVDGEGFVYTTGWTGSNFPAFNAIYPWNRGVRDAFVVKLSPGGDKVVYSTHLGGSFADDAKRIAVDGAGSAYIVGTTESLNFRVQAPYQRVIAGETDAFVAKIDPDGSDVVFATYLGGRGNEHGIDIAVNPAGEAYVLGRTDSPNFPRASALQNSRLGPTDLFVTRFAAAGDALVFSTYLGGNGDEGDCVQAENFRDLATPTPDGRGTRYLEGSKFTDGPVGGIAIDAAGRVHVASCTSSGNLPLANPLQTRRTGDYAILLDVLDPLGANLLFGTYLGGRAMNVARALAVGGDGGIYLAGQTDSTDFPIAPAANPLQGSRSGTDDAFVLKIGDALPEAPTVTPPIPPVTATATDVPTVEATEKATPMATATATAISVTLTSTPTSTRPASSTPTATPTATPDLDATPTARASATASPGGREVYLPIVAGNE